MTHITLRSPAILSIILPYAERSRVKGLGAQWDPIMMVWTLPVMALWDAVEVLPGASVDPDAWTDAADAYCRNLVASGVTLREVDGRVVASHPAAALADLRALQVRIDMRSAAILRLMREGREYVWRAPDREPEWVYYQEAKDTNVNCHLIKPDLPGGAPQPDAEYTKAEPDLSDPRLTEWDNQAAVQWAGWVRSDAAERAIVRQRAKGWRG